MNVLYIGVAAFIGGLISGVLGWAGSQEKFDPRKFSTTVLRSLLGAVSIAVAYNYVGNITAIDYGMAVLAGAGIDAGAKRIAGSIANRNGG